MTEVKLPAHITQEQYDEAVAKYGKCKVFTLYDEDENEIGEVVAHRPSAHIMEEFKKKYSSNPTLAERLLIKGSFVGADKEKYGSAPANSDAFIAAVKAATEMLPFGKAAIKN